MSFSTADLQAIKAAVNGDSTALGHWTAGNRGALCAYLNAAPSSGATMLTRTDVSSRELFPCIVATEEAALNAAQLALLELAGEAQVIDFTRPNVAAGITAVFPSTTQTYKNVMAIAQRPATRLEALFTVSGVCSHYGATIDVPTLIEAMAS